MKTTRTAVAAGFSLRSFENFAPRSLVGAFLLASAVLTLPFLSGCALFSSTATQVDKAAQIQSLAYGAASFGTQFGLAQNPAWRPAFENAYQQLDALVTQKTVTGALLRNILASLPVKELKSDKARIAIEGATYLFDVTVGSKLDIEAQPYVLAAATGIRDGMKAALGH